MSSKTEIADTKSSNVVVTRGAKKSGMNLTVTDNLALTADYPPVLILAAAGAVDLLLPAVATSRDLTFWLFNASGQTITLKTAADVALSPVVALADGERAFVVCNGIVWLAAVCLGTS